MKKRIFFLLISPLFCKSQSPGYEDSLNNFIRKYVQEHEVVKAGDKKLMQFYPADVRFRVVANFQKTENSKWFWLATSGAVKKEFRVYGSLSFILKDTLLQLQVYQSRSLMATTGFEDYLFIPFTDKTTGIKTYGGGRYIDMNRTDIHGNVCVLDFNKAYNPYCAYAAGFNCPIPPKENDLGVSIEAGEKIYLKH